MVELSDGFEDDGIEDDGIEDEETPAPALPSPAVPSPSAPASPAAKTVPSHGTPPTPPAAVSDEKRPPKKAALGGDGRAEKPWSAHAPAGGRATVGSYAQPDPATAGYYERPASSLIQMLLSTRARRRQIRSQMRTERESQALKAEAAEGAPRARGAPRSRQQLRVGLRILRMGVLVSPNCRRRRHQRGVDVDLAFRSNGSRRAARRGKTR